MDVVGDERLVSAVRALARASRALERVSPDLSLAQYRLLWRVAAGDERATDLAGGLALAKPTITAMVDSLVCRGLLARGESAGDRRVVRLEVTPDGRRALAETEGAMSADLADLLVGCADPDGVVGALTDLGAALDRRRARPALEASSRARPALEATSRVARGAQPA